ncbi:hypothetical protein P7C73_g2913, partial [Tremellales sp. Uapishka_1]
MPKFDPAVCIGPFKGGQEIGVTVSYLQAISALPLKDRSSNAVPEQNRTGMIKERFQPATHPKVEELHLLHGETGWSIRVANRLGVKEQQYFEKRQQGFIDAFEGYRKSDTLLGATYFNGILYDPVLAERKLNFHATNVLVLSLSNC